MDKIIGYVGTKTIERTNALTLISDSKEYYNYYLRGKPNKKNDISKVSYFLLLRSLELSLKAMIKIKEGISASELKDSKKFGHDILKLYKYCTDKKYLQSQGKEEQLAIGDLGTFYKNKDFEYTKVGYKYIPVLSYILNVLERVYKEFDMLSQDPKQHKYL